MTPRARRTRKTNETARQTNQATIDTARQTNQATTDAAREEQFASRYSRALEQVGSTNLYVRIGGVYALEGLALDSPRYHPTVMEVLTAFIRERSRAAAADAADPAAWRQPDVQTALTVVGRREAERDIRYIDLNGAKLSYADLRGLNLAGAKFIGAKLTFAELGGANLTDAEFAIADLDHADFTGANLTGAHFASLNLAGAKFTGANLTGAEWEKGVWVPDGWERDGEGRLRRAGQIPGGGD